MYYGTNPTALQSQQWLADSLLALMQQQPYTQITIQSICKQADLSRQTFYNFFHTKEDILRFCLQTQYEKQFAQLNSQRTLSIQDAVEAFANVLQENQLLLTTMIENQLDSIITDEIAKCVAMFAHHFADPKQDPQLLPYSIALLSGALAHVLLYWYRQETPISVEKLTELLTDFLSGSLATGSTGNSEVV